LLRVLRGSEGEEFHSPSRPARGRYTASGDRVAGYSSSNDNIEIPVARREAPIVLCGLVMAHTLTGLLELPNDLFSRVMEWSYDQTANPL
jgi:hypothetical protein